MRALLVATVIGGLACGGTSSSTPADASAAADANAAADASAAADANTATDAGAPAPSAGKDFVCNEVIGLQATGQWYAAGFENDGVDGTHWQAKTQHLAYIEKWADPANAVWNQALTSPCATASDAPDRVVFVGFSPPTMTEQAWEDFLVQDIATIRAKYPSVKEIDVMSMVRAPGNQPCPGNTDPLVMIYPYIDQAIEAAVRRAGPIARVAPPVFLPSCDQFVPNDTDLLPAGAAAVARTMATLFGP